jgi:hypothetical protein
MRITRGRNYVPKFRGKLFEDEDLKRHKIGKFGPMKWCHAPSTWEKCLAREKILGHGIHRPCAQGIFHASRAWFVRHSHAPCAVSMRPIHMKMVLLWVKPALFAQTQVETLTKYTSLPHSEFLVQNCGSSKGRQLWSFRRVSIFSLIFEGMFLSLVICF